MNDSAGLINLFSYLLMFSSGALMVISTVQYAMRTIQRHAYMAVVIVALVIALASCFILHAQPVTLPKPTPQPGTQHYGLTLQYSRRQA